MNNGTNGHTHRNGLSDHRGRSFAEVAGPTPDPDAGTALIASKDKRPMSVQIADLNERIAQQRNTIDQQRREMEHFAQHHDEHVRELSRDVEEARASFRRADERADALDSKLRAANGQVNALKNALASMLSGVVTQNS